MEAMIMQTRANWRSDRYVCLRSSKMSIEFIGPLIIAFSCLEQIVCLTIDHRYLKNVMVSREVIEKF